MILQFLSNAVRTVQGLVTHNSSRSSLLSFISTNIHRTVYTDPFQLRLPSNVRKSVEKIMGPRPKQPLPPYFRFVQQIRPQVIAEHPHLKAKYLYNIFSDKWRSLDPEQKAIFSAEFKSDMREYEKEIWKYNRKINGDDLKRVQKEIQDSEDKKQIKYYREEARKLNKPKRPASAFAKFLQSQSDRAGGGSTKEYMQRMSLKWWSLSETERNKYKTKPEELENYKKSTQTWEENITKSIAERDGNENVRKMPKRKCDGELVKFVWKRNVKYDVMLLSEVEAKNPFAFKNAKRTWEEIADVLQKCPLQMKVTHRSCRERVSELLKVHRGEEQRSKKASGIEEPDMTEMKHLLTSVAKLHEGGPDKQVSEMYAKNGRSEAEAIRNSALLAVQSEDDFQDDTTNEPIESDVIDSVSYVSKFAWNSTDNIIDAGTSNEIDCSSDPTEPSTMIIIDGDETATADDVMQIVESSDLDRVAASKDANQKDQSNSKSNKAQKKANTTLESRVAQNDADLASVQMFFDDEEDPDDKCDGDRSEKLAANSRKSNPKRELVHYLESKSEKEYEVRKEEIKIRKDEVKIREKENDVKKNGSGKQRQGYFA
ncbi:hypothetical protein HA402_006815 [Bradysia odoriphaga]|nr:hypothetical protein HA402_006815 [Bradysia odoriphaga]